jgi:hypothetical protein
MDKALRTVVTVLGGLLLAAALFWLGAQLYWGFAARPVGMAMPMMGRAWLGMHEWGAFRWFPSLGGLFGLGLLVLVVLGIVALVRGPRAVAPARACAHCGAPLEAGWVACPRCGEKV